MGLRGRLGGAFSEFLLDVGQNGAVAPLAQASVTVTVETLVHLSLNKSQLSTNTGTLTSCPTCSQRGTDTLGGGEPRFCPTRFYPRGEKHVLPSRTENLAPLQPSRTGFAPPPTPQPTATCGSSAGDQHGSPSSRSCCAPTSWV